MIGILKYLSVWQLAECQDHIIMSTSDFSEAQTKAHDRGYQQGRADAIESIMSGYPDFKALESLMIEYFERVDLTSEKTDMERLALEIVTRGMQTLGCLNGELEQLKGKK